MNSQHQSWYLRQLAAHLLVDFLNQNENWIIYQVYQIGAYMTYAEVSRL